MANKKVRLYEFSAIINRHVVVAATSREDAKAELESWDGETWEGNSDLISVSDVDLFDVRNIKSSDIDNEAHEVTSSAAKVLENRNERA